MVRCRNRDKRYILQELYSYFEIQPWTKSVIRTQKKNPKSTCSIGPKSTSPELDLKTSSPCTCSRPATTGPTPEKGTLTSSTCATKKNRRLIFSSLKTAGHVCALSQNLRTPRSTNERPRSSNLNSEFHWCKVLNEANHFYVRKNQLIMSATRLLAGLP